MRLSEEKGLCSRNTGSSQGAEAQLCLCRKWFALLVAFIYTIIGIMAAIGAVRSIVSNAVTYHLFANL